MSLFSANCWLSLQTLQSKLDTNCSKRDDILPSSPSSRNQDALSRLQVIQRRFKLSGWGACRSTVLLWPPAVTARCLPLGWCPPACPLPSEASKPCPCYLLLLQSTCAHFFHLFGDKQMLDLIAGTSQSIPTHHLSMVVLTNYLGAAKATVLKMYNA